MVQSITLNNNRSSAIQVKSSNQFNQQVKERVGSYVYIRMMTPKMAIPDCEEEMCCIDIEICKRILNTQLPLLCIFPSFDNSFYGVRWPLLSS